MGNSSVVLLLVVLMSIPVVYSVAFGATSAELSRESDIDVISDPEGVISLEPNTNFELIQINSGGEVTVEPFNLSSGADSLNRETTLFIGNTQEPSQEPAFTLNNISPTEATFDLSVVETPNNTADNPITYYIESDTRSETISVDESTSFTLLPGEELYVSIEIDSQLLTNTDRIDTDLLIESESGVFISRAVIFDISESTENNPILAIENQDPIESEEDDIFEMTNNYDTSTQVDVEVRNQNDEVVDTDSFFIEPNNTILPDIEFDANLRNCEDANREFEYTYTWTSNGEYITVDELEDTFTVCAQGGGPPGGGGGGPPEGVPN